MRVSGKIVLEAKSWRLLREAACTIDYLTARSTIPEEVCIEISWIKNGKPIASDKIQGIKSLEHFSGATTKKSRTYIFSHSFELGL